MRPLSDYYSGNKKTVAVYWRKGLRQSNCAAKVFCQKGKSMNSVVISELVLAAVCAYSAQLLWRFSPLRDRSWGALAALITAVAALLGALKFGTEWPVADAHRMAVSLSRLLALPLLALAWLFAVSRWPRASGGRLLLVVLVFAATVCHQWLMPLPYYAEGSAPVSIGLIALLALSQLRRRSEFALLGFAGAAQLALAGLVIGSRGQINGYLAVDIFHYLLASAWLSMAIALRRVD